MVEQAARPKAAEAEREGNRANSIALDRLRARRMRHRRSRPQLRRQSLGQRHATKATAAPPAMPLSMVPAFQELSCPGCGGCVAHPEIGMRTKLANKSLPSALPTSTFLFCAISPRTKGKTLAKRKIREESMQPVFL